MTETNTSETATAGPDKTDRPASEHPRSKAQPMPSEAHSAAEPPESSTKGMLRDAIQKVMDEIEFHESEAKKHLQQAQSLRKDLRDSFSFLQEKRGEGKTSPPPAEGRASKGPEKDTKGKKEPAPPAKQQPVSPKKKPSAGKAKEA